MQDIKGCFEEKYSKTLRVHIEKEMILKDYLPKGFTNFKISGRCCDFLKKRPFKLYEKKTNLKPFVGTLTDESI